MPSDGEDAQDEVLRVAEMFGEVARLLAGHESIQVTLNKIVELAVEHLDGCEFAGISLVRGREITSPASSNDIPRTLDKIQEEVGEGPCLDAIKEHEVFQTGDLAAEGRWPQFSKRAFDETGVRSVLSLRLFVEHDTMGALNLYATDPDAFDEADVALGSVFAVHAAVAMASARREEGLERKAEGQEAIGRAKGIIMGRSGVSDERAFEMLKAASQRLNLKLRDVARQVNEGTAAGDEPPA